MSDKVVQVVDIYSDGACKGNPGIGGWGALLVSGEHRRELVGGERMTTNNRMEMMAVIEALQSLKSHSNVCIHTDSQYVMKGMTEWLPGWKRRNWRTSSNAPVKNVDLWQRLDALTSQHAVEWFWVRGHSGHPGNERADVLANQGILTVR
jgi:ribonuclease HI